MKKLFLILTAITSSIYFNSCSEDDKTPAEPLPAVSDSFVQVIQQGTIDNVVSKLEATLLQKNFNIPAFSPIEHDVIASNINLELRPTRLFVFGNPKSGTLLMQENQQIGIDLPLKMLAFTNDKNQNVLGFYTASTLAERYNIKNTELLTKIDTTLFEIAGVATATPLVIKKEPTIPLVEKESTQDLETTISQLKTAITEKGFEIIDEVAHDIAAQSVNLALRPTRVIIFGKQEDGIILTQSDNRVGVDLPQKVLIYQTENGAIKVAFHSDDFLSKRYNLENDSSVLQLMKNTLEYITDAAIK